jgi:hypothetical protein
MGKENDCLGCGQKFKQKDACVQCSICGLWSHKTCAGLSNEFFNAMVEQMKATGQTFWGCRACSTYAAGMNHRLKEIHDKAQAAVDLAKETAKEQAQLKEQIEKDKEVTSKKVEKCELNIYEEMNLREEKRKNVVIHGLVEPEGEDGKTRMESDKRKLDQIFTVLELNISVDTDVEFCRRIGKKAERSRPLICGFYSEWVKSVLLKNSRYLAETNLNNVSVVPDLTERQRREERDLVQEAKRRNREELTSDDKAKNWVWKVVGRKGQKRLVKGTEAGRGGWGRGASRGTSRGAGAVGGANIPATGVNLLPVQPQRGAWEPSVAARGREASGGRKRRMSGDGERVRKRGTGRGRPPIRGRTTNQSTRQQTAQADSHADNQQSSQTVNTEEEEEEAQEGESQMSREEETEEEMEETPPAGIRTGEE